MDLKEVLALLRRYAEAIVEGRIEAKDIAAMSDTELATFDDELSAQLNAAQKEAEDLAGIKNEQN